MAVRYEYDAEKARRNVAKHGVSFAEAQTVLNDPNAISIKDDDSDPSEPREITIGMSAEARILVVVYLPKENDVIRLISARKATPNERKEYSS